MTTISNDKAAVYVAFSGGKDSTALALMMPDAIPVFTDTQWEHGQLYDHIRKFEDVTGREVVRIQHPDWPGGLPQYISENQFFPNYGARYCTRIFKIEAFNLWVADKLPAEFCIGLRADEPERVGNLSFIDGLTIRYPLREWGMGVYDVLQTCAEAGLLPRYPAYMAGGGCVGCFYKTKGQVLSFIHQAPPEEVDAMQELEEAVQDQRGRYFHAYGNAGMSVADLRRQPLLFDDSQVFAEASNVEMAPACGLFCRR